MADNYVRPLPSVITNLTKSFFNLDVDNKTAKRVDSAKRGVWVVGQTNYNCTCQIIGSCKGKGCNAYDAQPLPRIHIEKGARPSQPITIPKRHEKTPESSDIEVIEDEETITERDARSARNAWGMQFVRRRL